MASLKTCSMLKSPRRRPKLRRRRLPRRSKPTPKEGTFREMSVWLFAARMDRDVRTGSGGRRHSKRSLCSSRPSGTRRGGHSCRATLRSPRAIRADDSIGPVPHHSHFSPDDTHPFLYMDIYICDVVYISLSDVWSFAGEMMAGDHLQMQGSDRRKRPCLSRCSGEARCGVR